MKLTKFTLYKNTPLTNLQNTIHFKSNEEREEFFKNHYKKVNFDGVFNFRKDRGVLHAPLVYEELMGYNYCQFVDGFDGKTYYAFIIGMTYLNDKTTKLDILIDLVMTYTQGNILQNVGYVEVLRSHLPELEYQNNLERLRTSQDMPQVTTLRYSHKISDLFGDTYVLLYSSVDFTKDFGDAKKPKMEASSGGNYDKMTSPVDLYIIERNDFQTFSKTMQQFPWIMQNVSKCLLIPKRFVDENDLEKITTKSGFDGIYKLASNQVSNDVESSINITKDELLNMLEIDKEQELHLLRSGFATLELTDFKGQTMALDLSKVEGIKCTFKILLGYKNEIHLIVEGYGSRTSGSKNGYYLNFSLGFVDFDEMPILINNYELAKAKSSYSRELGNDRTISGRLNKITDKNSNVNDRIFNSLSVFSDVFSGGLAGSISKGAGLFANEYEHYRDQNAQFAEMALTPPSVTNQVAGNAFLVKSNDWGVHLLVSTLTKIDRNRVRQYYNMFGFEINEHKLLDKCIDCNDVCNWLQFKGYWFLPDIDIESLNALRNIFEGGVRFWHNKNVENPMQEALYKNKRVK